MKRIIIVSLISMILFSSSCVNNANKESSTKDWPKENITNSSLIDSIQSESNDETIENLANETNNDGRQPESNELQIVRKQTFKYINTTVFTPQNKKIVLMQDSLEAKLILFQTMLQVNTDGTPISYHPFDLRGKTKAINTIGNAVAIKKDGEEGNIFLKQGYYTEAMSVFEQFRDSDYEITPSGYTIIWKNVLIAEKVGGIEKPCILKSGKYEGYYASATSLQNGLTTNKGDCNCNNQVNPLEVPALVLVGGRNNALKDYGARVGDLLVAYNPENGVVSYAIINDVGPKNKLGEGSVLLNMQLTQNNEFPKTRKDTYQLTTNDKVIISVIPNSRKYNVEKPFTAANIKTRITSWMNENGFSNEEEFVEFLKENMQALI